MVSGVMMDGPKSHVADSPSRPAFEAYSGKEKGKVVVSKSFKVALVALDCLFLGLQPVLVHLSKNSKGTYSFHPVAVNFMVELAKTLFALIVLLFTGTGRTGAPMYRSMRAFIVDAHHNKLLAVPAALYAVNNSLKFSMQLFFRPTTTKMLGNLKIFTIALLMKLIMRRTFNVIQWEALFLLVAGITINQLQSCGSGPNPDEANIPLIPAVLCTLGTVTVPAAASVYNEFALKKHMDTSVHLQNFFLYFYGALFNLLFLGVTALREKQSLGQMFQGLSLITYLLIANNAAQGVLSSFFYKFADTILKKYSSTIATIWTALLSFALFGHALTINFFLGVSIVFVSMHQFFTFGDKSKPGEPPRPKIVYSPSLDHIALAAAGGANLPGAETAELRRPLLPR
ncbi:hypothetical protein HYH02_014345 [Chlamydomonas schloesseri]|uniref:Nucleotide-sugar transporter n=1 Tax=Chlamydomonas schloesseri TaxID=2026947 RepID=A0A835SZ36_9CHLO|nr:hypothetical protein HYH02_014345 [Chlamydomonas schloesseri]|eukprot:KAG2428541.1 hypothetical protein HYH02_014345 [Chlamydomonas schloesseri]